MNSALNSFSTVGSYSTRIMVIFIGSKRIDSMMEMMDRMMPLTKTLLELRYVRHCADSAIPDSLTSTQFLRLQSNNY